MVTARVMIQAERQQIQETAEALVRTQTMLAFRTYSGQLFDQCFGVGLDESQRQA